MKAKIVKYKTKCGDFWAGNTVQAKWHY